VNFFENRVKKGPILLTYPQRT